MATAQRTPTDTSEGNGAQPSAANGAAADLLTESWRTYGTSVFAVNQELSDFIGHRLEENMKFGKALSECKDLGDMTSLQQDWMAQATKQYVEESTKLFRACFGGLG